MPVYAEVKISDVLKQANDVINHSTTRLATIKELVTRMKHWKKDYPDRFDEAWNNLVGIMELDIDSPVVMVQAQKVYQSKPDGKVKRID
jgi:hypothetical protein